MVATTHYLATEAGLSILRDGGNAFDAAAAVQFALNVVQPQSTGVGGGAFAMFYDAASKQVYSLDSREEAPAAFHGAQFCINNDCLFNVSCDCTEGVLPYEQRYTGSHPVGVPGLVRGVGRMLNDFGTMSLSQVLQPAIRLAREGFPMSQSTYNSIVNEAHRLALFEASRKLYLSPNDVTKPIVEVGETWKNPDLADTYQLLAEKGVDVFYTGEIGRDILATVQNTPNPQTGKYGLMTEADIDGYLAVYRTPLNTTYRGRTVFGMNLPAGNIVQLEMLNILEGFDISQYGPLSVDALHRLFDVQNLGFADRNKYAGDADFVDVPVEGLLSKPYAANRRDLTSPTVGIPTPILPGTPDGAQNYPISKKDFERGTTHFSIGDKYGNTVAMTSTIEMIFGSAVVVPGRGFVLNNELTDFEEYGWDANGDMYANAPEGQKKARRTAIFGDAATSGGKRPRSSMTPTLVFNSTLNSEKNIFDYPPYLATGSPGGSSIIGATFSVLVNIIDFKMEPQEATDHPRALAKNGPTSAEAPIYEEDNGGLIRGLEERAFVFASPVPTTATYGRVQTVMRTQDGYFVGAADALRVPEATARGF
eukprot:TRINITY_DN16478_c0_g1_i1.p1 TRINITY_DN16478_c0_g1~~TRINITY_DN16478_c0_g1_i1.p1  ORF type:complete len:663 (+),score=167.88 TRINITY_DN16478_c0_g1_i1:216-1991(+)